MRGYTNAQQSAAAAFRRANPVCCDPFNLHPNQTKPTAICDHIIPKFKGGTDDVSNYQALCRECDRYKTAREGQEGRQGR